MKIQAKDLKAGMTITQGKWSMLVDSFENSKQKNGIPTIIVKGLVSNTTKNIYGKIAESYNTEITYKKLTTINIR